MLAVLLNSIKLQKKRKVLSDEKIQNMDCCRTCLNAEDLEPIFDKQQPVKRRTAELKTVTGLEIDATDGLSQKICKICSKIIKLCLKLRETAIKSQTTLLKIECKQLLKKPKLIEDRKPTRKSIKLKTKTESKLKTKQSKQTNFLDTPILPPLPPIKPELDEDNFFNDKFETNLVTDQNPTSNIPNYNFETTIQKCEWPYDDYDPGQDQDYDNNHEDGSEQLLMERKQTRTRRASRLPKVPVGSKPFCGECKKDFLSEKSYKIHMKLHLDCCVCELCGKKCRNNNLLLLHKRGKHGAERIHKCSYCEYAGASREALTIHERRHTGEKPYICDHCGSGFHRRSNLIQHIAIHLPDKNFQCEICAKRFQSKKFLRSHKFKQHQERRYLYLCQVCKSHFRTTDSVRKHQLRAHGMLKEHQGPVLRVPIQGKRNEE